MEEQKLEREFDEVLTMVKAVERKMLENGDFNKIKEIFSIHLAVFCATYSIDDALEFIKSMYAEEKK